MFEKSRHFDVTEVVRTCNFCLCVLGRKKKKEEKRHLSKRKSLRVQQTVAAFNFPGHEIIWVCQPNTVTAEEDIRVTGYKERLDDEQLTTDENMSVELVGKFDEFDHFLKCQ